MSNYNPSAPQTSTQNVSQMPSGPPSSTQGAPPQTNQLPAQSPNPSTQDQAPQTSNSSPNNVNPTLALSTPGNAVVSGGQYPNDLYSTNQNKAQPNQQAHPHQSVSVPNLGDIANFIYSAAPFKMRQHLCKFP